VVSSTFHWAQAAALFDLGISTVVHWVWRFRQTGSVAAKPMGGDYRSRLTAERAWLLERIEAEPDLTLEELRDGLKKRGVSAGYGTVWTVLTNPQSYLCGLCAGLLFLPTTVGSMIWGVSFLREGWHIDYAEAVNRASMVPLGWVIGCPLLGYIADHTGRRKPVLMVGMVLMLVTAAAVLYLPPNTFPPYLLGSLFGIGSGAAMTPYTIIKEVNPDKVKGSATGAINFLVFVMTAFAAPAYGGLLQKLAGGGALTLEVFTKGGSGAIIAIILAFILALFIKETGSAVCQSH
jgi:sugar phosphate permease